jgi:hypothetical protein
MGNLQETVTIDSLVRRIDSKGVGKEFIALNLSGEGSATFTLSAAVRIVATLFNQTGLKLLATAHFTFYQDSVSGDNRIPTGTNIDASDYQLAFYYDEVKSDGNNVKFTGYILNQSGSDQTIIVNVNYRFIIEQTEDISGV